MSDKCAFEMQFTCPKVWFFIEDKPKLKQEFYCIAIVASFHDFGKVLTKKSV